MSTLTAVGTVVVGTAALGTLGYPVTVASRSDRPSARPFLLLMALLLLWTVCIVASALPGVPTVVTSAWIWEAGRSVGSLGIPIAWVVYARSYAGRTRWRTPAVIGMAVLALFSIAATSVPALQEGPIAALAGLLILLEFGVAVLAFCYGTWILYRLSRTHNRVETWQVVAVAIAVATPYVLRFILFGVALVRFAFAEVPPEQTVSLIPITDVPGGFFLTGLVVSGAVRQYPLLSSFPRADAVARATVVRDLREPVIVLDYDDHILDVNASAAATFGWERNAISGRSLAAVDAELGQLDLLQDTTGTAWLTTTAGRRQFQFSVSPVGESSPTGNHIAKAVLLRDVTDRRIREQRLEVLNRVLRHNIRNKVDVAMAYTNEIDDSDIRTPVRQTLQNLEALGNRARQAERVMAAAATEPTDIDLVAILQDIAGDYREQTATLVVSAPDSLVVASHESILRTVLAELVENAIVHAGEPPTVELTLVDTNDGIELTVTDDGPGIPTHEQEILEEETETQLSHGSGLGLWIVQWGVRQLGGELQFTEREPTGTVATVLLYTSVSEHS